MTKLVDKADVIDKWAQKHTNNADLETITQAFYDGIYGYMDKLTDAEIIEEINGFDSEFLSEEDTVED